MSRHSLLLARHCAPNPARHTDPSRRRALLKSLLASGDMLVHQFPIEQSHVADTALLYAQVRLFEVFATGGKPISSYLLLTVVCFGKLCMSWIPADRCWHQPQMMCMWGFQVTGMHACMFARASGWLHGGWLGFVMKSHACHGTLPKSWEPN